MKKYILFAFIAFGVLINSNAQDYLDLLSVSTSYQPMTVSDDGSEVVVHARDAELLSPIPLDKEHIILSGVEYMSFDVQNKTSSDQSLYMHSLVSHLGYMAPLNEKWTASITLMNKLNSNSTLSFKRKNVAQYGGNLLLYDKLDSNKTLKFGAYLNKDVYGFMLVPIFGYDIRFNKGWNLFGNFPINTTLAKKMSNKCFVGLFYRGMITSYEYTTSEKESCYLERSNDELDFFTDLYLTKNLVLNFRAGLASARHYQLYDIDDKLNFRVTVFKFGEDRVVKNPPIKGTSLNFQVGLKWRLDISGH